MIQTASDRTSEDVATATRHALILRDGITFLVLALTAAVLSGVTWFLFRSFTSHRTDLATQAAERGRLELSQGKPDQAIVDLRTALSFAPDDHDDELLLAEALGAAGHTEEATNYFLGLWDAKPGDGFINLQLARLSRKSKRAQEAIDYYRASIFGSWGGQGVERRREVRLELADYLIERHELEAARVELLTAGSNNAGDAKVTLTLGDALLRAQDTGDALSYYEKAIVLDPENAAPLERAGRLAYSLGDYALAHKLLERAARLSPGAPELTSLIDRSERLLELDIARDLPARIRTQHLLVASDIAKKRLDSCVAKLNPPGSVTTLPPALTEISLQWAPLITRAGRNSIAHDPDTQDTAAQLIGDTEVTAARFCGPPAGDDALLLKLAQSSNAAAQ